MKQSLPILFVVAVAFALLYPRPAPRERPNPAPSGTSGVAGSTSLPQPNLQSEGWCWQTSVLPLTDAASCDLSASPEPSGLNDRVTASPLPTGGIGQPASYCRQFCDSPEPRVVVSKGSGNTLRGSATWYAWHPGEAAAGPGLRAWLGADWRGTVVTVIAPGCECKPVAVTLTDWCLCRDDRIVDLDRASFAALADPDRGIIPVLILEGDWTQ